MIEYIIKYHDGTWTSLYANNMADAATNAHRTEYANKLLGKRYKRVTQVYER